MAAGFASMVRRCVLGGTRGSAPPKSHAYWGLPAHVFAARFLQKGFVIPAWKCVGFDLGKRQMRVVRPGQKAVSCPRLGYKTEVKEQTKSMNKLPDASAVIKVGDGRGFLIQHRTKLPRLPPSLRSAKFKPLRFREDRLIVTAAHCLPHLPPAHASSYIGDRTYKRLLGTLDGNKRDVWAVCWFVDPVADIAVLGSPEDPEDEGLADAYYDLTNDAFPLDIGKASNGGGWVLSLENQWVSTTLELRPALRIDATQPGMSGSPILNRKGLAVGVVAIGAETIGKSGERTNERAGPQPVLLRNLPGWLIGMD